MAPTPREPSQQYRRRLVAMFALATMEKEGPIHGYRVAERISERTEGAWRPGAGAVYPALRRMVEHGLARTRTEGRRKLYEITPSGKGLLQRIRTMGEGGRPGPAGFDPSVLWAEVHGIRDLNEFHLRRFRRDLSRLEARVHDDEETSRGPSELRGQVRLELAQALERLGAARPRPTRGRPAR